MSVTGRITVWLIPSLLIWGGCAAPAVVNSPATIDSTVAEDPADAKRLGEEVPPLVQAEAALIRGLALEKGYGETAANQFEQSVLNAQPNDRQFLTRLIYAQLNKADGATAADPSAAPIESANASSPNSAPYVVSPAFGGARVPSTSPEETSPEASRASLERAGPPNERNLSHRQPAASSAVDGPGNNQRASHSRSLASSTQSDSPPSRNETGGLSDINTGGRQDSHRATLVSANQQAEIRTEGNPVRVAGESPEADAQLSWQRQLRLAIVRLRRDLEVNEELDPLDESRLRACLGLLQLAAEDPEGAMESLQGLDEQQLEFWRQTVLGLDVLLDSDDLPKLRYRVETAVEHLHDGLSALETLGPLRVNNLAFVSAVRGFGEYDEISPHTFSPGDQALLYVEIGNFTTELISSDEPQRTSTRRRPNTASQVPTYETDLSGRYEILDQSQRVVVSRTLPIIVDNCREHRRDFFIPYDFSVPRDISPGNYTVELTIKDRKGDKFGSGTIDMKIR